jgi:antitoxin HicB
MRWSYPARIERSDFGDWVVSFRDIPEALTGGESFEEACALAEDCLIAALGFYTDLRNPRPITRPSTPRPGEHLIDLPPLVAAKLALYEAMREEGITNTALALRLGVTEAVVRRLLDLDHRSHIGQVEKALALLGKKLVLEILEAA